MWIYFVINPSLSIGIGDPVASVGRLALSFTDRRNSSLRKKLYVTFPSDTIGRTFRKSKTTLAGAPMVPEHEHLRLTLSLPGKLNRT